MVRLLRVEERHVLVPRVRGALIPWFLAGRVECLAQRRFQFLVSRGVAPVAPAAPRRRFLVGVTLVLVVVDVVDLLDGLVAVRDL